MKTPVSAILPVSAGSVLTTSDGTSFTAGATIGVAGAWNQIIAATDTDSYGVYCYPSKNSQGWFDIGVGAAGVEQPVAQIPSTVANNTMAFFCPVFIPAGSRLSVRAATANYADVCTFSCTLVRSNSRAPMASYGRLIGFDAAATPPYADSGVTAHTKGAYTQLTAATTRDAKGYSLMLKNRNGNTQNAMGFVDLAVGASGSEQIILANAFYSNPGYYGTPSVFGPIWTPVPSGSRIAVRSQSDRTAAGETKVDTCLVLWE